MDENTSKIIFKTPTNPSATTPLSANASLHRPASAARQNTVILKHYTSNHKNKCYAYSFYKKCASYPSGVNRSSVLHYFPFRVFSFTCITPLGLRVVSGCTVLPALLAIAIECASDSGTATNFSKFKR